MLRWIILENIYHLGALLKTLFEEDVEKPIVSLTPSEQVDRQIKGYSCIDYESDHLQCWYSCKDEFPVIAILAKRCLCVCGTSVSFECLFSKVWHTIGNLCDWLSPDTINMLFFLENLA